MKNESLLMSRRSFLSHALVIGGIPILGSPGSDPGIRQAPGGAYDLRWFDLGLPVDKYGNPSGLADIKKGAQLAGPLGYVSDYFYLDSNGAIVFWSPSNGATTTPGSGSDHTRSELRERFAGGDTNGNWTNALGGTLLVTTTVEKLASAANSATIGQIHSQNGILLLLVYNGATSAVEAVVYESPSSTKTSRVTVCPAVLLNTKITYALQWIGDSLSVRVNGLTRNFTTAAVWNNVPVYFKVGAYSKAPCTGNPDGDGTQVRVSALSIQH